MKKLSKSGQYAAKKADHKKSSVRAKVEHVLVSENTIPRSAKTDRQTEYYVCPGKPLSGWQKISDGLIKCACKQIYRGNMPVTELHAFNLICENLLAALFGIALISNWKIKQFVHFAFFE